MANLNGVNTNAEPQSSDFEPLVPGDYKAIVDSEESKTSKAGDEYLILKFKIIDGPGKNRVIFHNLNLWHSSSPKAKEIAEGHLSAIREAAGIPKDRFSDTQQLFNRPMLIRLGIEASPGYDPKNVIKSWKSLSSVPTAGGSSKPSTLPTYSTGSSTVVPSDADVRAFEDDMPEEMRKF
jgi:hypothetical protein